MNNWCFDVACCFDFVYINGKKYLNSQNTCFYNIVCSDHHHNYSEMSN